MDSKHFPHDDGTRIPLAMAPAPEPIEDPMEAALDAGFGQGVLSMLVSAQAEPAPEPEFGKAEWEKIKEWEENLTPEQERALDNTARLWFAVEKGYHDITGEWLQR